MMPEELDRNIALLILNDITDMLPAEYSTCDNKTLENKIVEILQEYRIFLHTEEKHDRKKGSPIDYEKIYAILRHQPITYEIIRHITGLKDNEIVRVITTLSLRYPLYSPGKGIYELLR